MLYFALRKRVVSIVCLLASTSLFSLILSCSTNNPSPLPQGLSINQIKLGELMHGEDVHIYPLKETHERMQMTISLYGHIYRRDEPVPPYLRAPRLILETRSTQEQNAEWVCVQTAESPLPDVEIARLQNVMIEPGFEYQVKVSTQYGQGGRYALVIDPSIPGHEFEIEELDFGKDTQGRYHLLSTAFSAKDPALPTGECILIGTENGYILQSVDDAKSWSQIYPQEGGRPMEGAVFSLFQDSQGTIYASPWISGKAEKEKGQHGYVLRGKNFGGSWETAFQFTAPTGVAWRMDEDSQGNVFIGEYAATPEKDRIVPQQGNIWRKKHDRDTFEIVFSNPAQGADTHNNHVHFVGVDPFTDHIYATIGDGVIGRAVRSKSNGDPGSWETIETGVDAQYTAIVFAPEAIFFGTDTNKSFKKVVRWDRKKNGIEEDETFFTSGMMEGKCEKPVKWADKGNWFWGHHFPGTNTFVMQYLPYGTEQYEEGLMQSPRLFGGFSDRNFWWRALTFPPVPKSEKPVFSFYGPKLSSNLGPSRWVYAMRGTGDGMIHRGFRVRLKSAGVITSM